MSSQHPRARLAHCALSALFVLTTSGCGLLQRFPFLASRPEAGTGTVARTVSATRRSATAAWGGVSVAHSETRHETHSESHSSGPGLRRARAASPRSASADDGPTCNGDFSLGEMAVVCSDCGLGQTCNNENAPTNCADGMYIHIDGQCRCIARCSSFGVEPGGSCARGWTCRHVQATNAGHNHASVCVADAWNVCQR